MSQLSLFPSCQGEDDRRGSLCSVCAWRHCLLPSGTGGDQSWGSQYLVEAAVSERLPVAVLLERDVPGLANLLNRGLPINDAEQVEEAMAVTTQVQRQ